MNYAQFGLFFLYVFSVLIAGIGIYGILDNERKPIMNRSLYLGEVFLLGSILLVGQLLILSLVSLYKAPYLWAAVFINYLFLLNKTTRSNLYSLMTKKISSKIPTFIFIILVSIFIFRNCYFLIDIDSHSTYLFIQKVWLSKGTSITGNAGSNMKIFVPHFDAVPYSLGLSIFGKETLFPQLINLFWRLIALLLVFGYTSYRFNKYLGLASVMLILFNDHFFYSGINHSVLINGALIALLFAIAYNFWESRVQNCSFRFLLAIIFLSQLMANKYQMFYVLLFLLIIGILIQPNPVSKLKQLLINRTWLCAVCIALFIMSLWYLKNLLATGDPVFPVFAGKLGIFNWVPEKEQAFARIFGGLSPLKFIKYMNFLFVWPGITPAKYVIITISFLPLLLTIAAARNKIDRESVFELCFWLGLSIIVIMGICFISHQDPRYFRFSIGILSFAAVLSMYYIFTYCFRLRKELLLSGMILIFSLPGYKTMYQGFYNSPTFKENIDVLFNKIHTDSIIDRCYPRVRGILKEVNKNKEKFDATAWGVHGFNVPFFLLPIRPEISLWGTSVIRWDSYDSEDLIIKDLKKFGIKWVVNVSSSDPSFLPIDVYAREAVKYSQERYRKEIYYNYNLPQELSQIK